MVQTLLLVLIALAIEIGLIAWMRRRFFFGSRLSDWGLMASSVAVFVLAVMMVLPA
jgi:hypothetical protein